MDSNYINFFLLIFTALGVLVSACEIRTNRKLNDEAYKHSKAIETLDFAKENLNKFHEYNQFITSQTGKYGTAVIPYKIILKKPELEKIVREYTNDIEYLAYCVNKGFYDENIVMYLMGDFLLRRIEQFYDYYKYRRSLKPFDRTIFRQTLLLAKKINEKREMVEKNL